MCSSDLYKGKDSFKLKSFIKFKVSRIVTNENKIIEFLEIKDQDNKVRFSTDNYIPTKKAKELTEQEAGNHEEFTAKAVNEAISALGDAVGVTIAECNAYIDNKTSWSDIKKNAMKSSSAKDPLMRSNIVRGIIG